MATAELASEVAVKPRERGFFLNIEGTVHRWPVSTVTTEQVAELGCWDPAQGVLLIDADNNERQLQPGEVVHLKPGMEFGKKVHWKRG